MKDAGYFRAQAARCIKLRHRAKRADVRQALESLAQAYEGEALAAEGGRKTATAGGQVAIGKDCSRADADGQQRCLAEFALAWPVLAMHRHVASMLRVALAFSFGYWG
jgi:hypothetical protein